MADHTAARAASETGDPLLFTPGPLTTSRRVKEAMLHDWGSRDAAFIACNREVLAQLTKIVNAAASHVAVPLQGSGTFAVEAMLTSLIPPAGKVLLIVNGAYGERARRICAIAGRAYSVYETPQDTAPDPARIEALLGADPAITHVFAVHCETTSGIVNPIADIGASVARRGRRLLIDAISAFGALPLDAAETPFDGLAASPNKCLEGVPGLAFVICRREALEQAQGNATTLVLDLFAQWQAFLASEQYRFTPPTHVIAALSQALIDFWAEGGQAGRARRYQENCRVLIDGMRALGFKTLLPERLQGPIIVTFHMPRHAGFDFERFYSLLKERGFVIYPGKLTVAESFRIGCIGRLDAGHMRALTAAVAVVLADMGVGDLATPLGAGDRA